MTHPNHLIRLRLILTAVMITLYLLVLTVQAHAQSAEPRATLQSERTTYFSYNETSLSPETRRHLDELIENVKALGRIRGARVVGFADRTGSPSLNEKLSRKRAENVKKYLVSRGIVRADVTDALWFGDSFSATNCPENLSKRQLISCLQRDRRVEIEIDYAPRLLAAQ